MTGRRLVVGLAAALGGIVAPSVGMVDAKGTLTVSPTPVVLGSNFTLAGCGYPAPTSLSFRVVGPGQDYFTAGEPLSTDCFSDVWLAWWPTAGDYQITSYYRDSKGTTRKVAVVKFTVNA